MPDMAHGGRHFERVFCALLMWPPFFFFFRAIPTYGVLPYAMIAVGAVLNGVTTGKWLSG